MAKPSVALVHYSAPPVIGGVEFVLEEQARQFLAAGFPVEVVVGEGEKFHEQIPLTIIPELSTRYQPAKEALSRLSQGDPSHFNDASRNLTRRLVDIFTNIDCIIIHNILTMHFNLLATAALANLIAEETRSGLRPYGSGLRGEEKKFIAWVHDATFNDPDYAAERRGEYPWQIISAPIPEVIYVAISQRRREELARLFAWDEKRIPVVPDGVNMEAFLALDAEALRLWRDFSIAELDFMALTPTRIVKRKNLELGMKLVAEIKGRGKRIKWLITGAPDPHNPPSQEYFAWLKEFQQELGLKDDVIFLGEHLGKPVSFSLLRSLYCLADFLLLPSRQEGFGMPVLEGSLFRLPVVATEIAPFKAVGGEDVIYIGLDEDPARAAGRILSFLEESAAYRLRRRTLKSYTWQAVFEKYIRPLVET